MAGIDLERSGLDTQEVNNQHVWTLKVVATSNEPDLSAKIFVYHANMDDDAYEGDIFECVASVQQMLDLPEDAATTEDGEYVVPYYRSDVMLIDLRHPDYADDLWEDIQADVTDLVNNWRAAQSLSSIETVTIDPT